MAPAAGFEPATNWLTANCSTTELRWNISKKIHCGHVLLNMLVVSPLLAILLRRFSKMFTVRYNQTTIHFVATLSIIQHLSERVNRLKIFFSNIF